MPAMFIFLKVSMYPLQLRALRLSVVKSVRGIYTSLMYSTYSMLLKLGTQLEPGCILVSSLHEALWRLALSIIFRLLSESLMLRAHLGSSFLSQEAADLGDMADINSHACWDAEGTLSAISSSEMVIKDLSEE
jgi:hypothetical protein